MMELLTRWHDVDTPSSGDTFKSVHVQGVVSSGHGVFSLIVNRRQNKRI
jgi:hypothetical protein